MTTTVIRDLKAYRASLVSTRKWHKTLEAHALLTLRVGSVAYQRGVLRGLNTAIRQIDDLLASYASYTER